MIINNRLCSKLYKVPKGLRQFSVRLLLKTQRSRGQAYVRTVRNVVSVLSGQRLLDPRL